jgi:hypothetical protein
MPNKSHKPTDQTRSEVSALSSFGIPQEDIASYIGISHPTLRKHYGEELKVSSIKANAAVGKYLYRLASGMALRDEQNPASHSECSRSAMFWAKTRMGWRETTAHDHTSSDRSMTPQPSEIIIRAADAKTSDD